MLKVSSQRDYIAGEVSRDLTKRLLLPEKISKANEEGILYFHNSDYFMGTSINYCVTDVRDMLYNGTIINEVNIEEPRTFDKACNILTQIIAQVGSNLYGKQYIDLSCLGRFLRKSIEEYEKEFKFKERFNENELEEIISNYEQKQLKEGVQTIKYQLKTLNTTGGKEPQVILYLDLNQEKEYLKENLKIKEELIKQMPEEISEEKYKFQGKFNQGIVSINLPQIAIIADENEEKFYQILDERLELCKEA